MSDIDQDDRIDPAAAAELAHEARMAEVHTAIPARVESYANGRADVLPMVRRAVPRVDGGVLLEGLPVVRAVDVIQLGGGGYFVHCPVAAGDHVFLMMAEADASRFLETGELSDPVDHRRHHLAHAFAIPGLLPRPSALADTDALEGELVLGKRDGGPLVRLGADTIKVGRNASDKAAKATPTNDRIAHIESALSVLASAPFAANDGGALIQSAFATAWDAMPSARGTDVSATVAEVE